MHSDSALRDLIPDVRGSQKALIERSSSYRIEMSVRNSTLIAVYRRKAMQMGIMKQ